MTTTETPPSLRLLLIGATGAVGQKVLQQALLDPRVDQVVALTRRSLPPQSKLENYVVDFSDLPSNALWWRVDAVICTLGTTMKIAGSRLLFAQVDRDFPARVAKLTREAGATRFALTSSIGASLEGTFYLRIKAETEALIREVAFPNYTIVRPSLIDADRADSRLGESFAIFIARVFRLLIPKRYRAIKPQNIAHILLESVLRNRNGERIIESEELQN